MGLGGCPGHAGSGEGEGDVEDEVQDHVPRRVVRVKIRGLLIAHNILGDAQIIARECGQPDEEEREPSSPCFLRGRRLIREEEENREGYEEYRRDRWTELRKRWKLGGEVFGRVERNVVNGQQRVRDLLPWESARSQVKHRRVKRQEAYR